MPVLCMLCNQRPATTHLLELGSDLRQEQAVHLCASCVRERSLNLREQIPPLDQLISGKATAGGAASKGPLAASASKPARSGAEDPVCPTCGLRWDEFQHHNRFGCGNDYTAFGKAVRELLEQIHGQAQHVGRLPKASGEAARAQREAARAQREASQRERTRLEQALAEAVGAEDYRRAAAIRDQLRSLDDAATESSSDAST